MLLDINLRSSADKQAVMSTKRKNTGSTSDELRYAKRRRPTSDDEESDTAPSTTSNGCEKPRNDPVYGQKNAFPGLDGPGNDEILYGPPEDGIEYLRMVRSEANTLPHLFLAPKSSENENETTKNETNGVETTSEQPEGFYIDGVYVAASTTNDILPTHATDDSESAPDPQESYYNLLQHRFLLLRSTLKCTPPATAISALDTNHPISLPPTSKRAKTEWRRLLHSADPQMTQLASMDIDSVLAVMDLLTRLLSEIIRGGEREKVKRLGAWAWGLLGRCRDISELGSSEVGEIRELGKRAAKVLAKIRENQRAMEVSQQLQAQQEEDSEIREAPSEVGEGDTETMGEAEGGNSGPREAAEQTSSLQPEEIHLGGGYVSNDLEAAKARLQAKLATNDEAAVAAPSISTDEGEVVEKDDEDDNLDEPSETRKQARAMLDMIITIVGEFYGQRDLLEARDIWDEDLEEWS